MADPIKELEELLETLTIAIAREKASIVFYSNAYDKAVSENAQKIFSLLIEQEKVHEIKLREQLQEIKSQIELEKLKSQKQLRPR
jgi:rubrerythrin